VPHAYSLLTLKSFDEAERVISGIASTPSPDRMEDILEPHGVTFTLPIPLLWQHRSDQPIGHVTKATVTDEGIAIEAQLVKIDEPGALADRLRDAWLSIKSGLVRGLSVGFKPLAHEDIKGTWGIRFTKWLWLELSAVTIPANADASIQSIKSCDQRTLALSGTGALVDPVHSSAAAGRRAGVVLAPVGRSMKKTLADQIKDWERTRETKDARMTELMDAANEKGVTLDAAQTEEYDGLAAEVKDINAHIQRLQDQQQRQAAAAQPVSGSTSQQGTQSRAGIQISVKDSLPKGTLFTRYAMAIAAGRGSLSDALEYAKRWDAQTPEVSAYIKAAAGTAAGGSPSWGSDLTYPTNLAGEFIELLRPATILGKIPGLRRVPFNVRIPIQTGGSTVNWVGEAAAKPVSELAFDAVTLTWNKVAGIVVLTEELVRLSTPSAEETVRRDLVEQMARFIDAQFITPSVSAGANNPASVTNGVSGHGASGTDADSLYTDLNTALSDFDAADLGTESVVVIMPPALSRGIATLRNALGQFVFPTVEVMGGTLLGFPVIVSSSVPSGDIIFVKANEILLADDGDVRLDASNQATLDMAGGNTPAFSLWQQNCIGIRAERFITWKKRRAEAVSLITGAAYAPSSS